MERPVDDEKRSTRNDDDDRRMNHETARKCAAMMKMARNDTDRVAVLALIPKLMQSKHGSDTNTSANGDTGSDDQDLFIIAKSIPIDFCERLFQLKHDGGHILAIRMLARLLSSQAVVHSGKFTSLAHEIVEALLGMASTSLDDHTLVNDALFCCVQLGMPIISTKSFWSLLIQLLKDGSPEHIIHVAFTAYGRVCFTERSTLSTAQFGDVQSYMEAFLNVLLKRIRNDETQLHFDMLSQLSIHLSMFIDSAPVQSDTAPETILMKLGTWIRDLRVIIGNILKSRHTGDRERAIALDITSSLSVIFHSTWLDQDDVSFVQLLISMTSIEIRIILDNDRKMKLDNAFGMQTLDPFHLAKCCQFLEMAIRLVATSAESLDDGESARDNAHNTGIILTQQQILQINKSLLEVTEFLLEYLTVMDEENLKVPLPIDVAYPVYRFICAYLAEGLELIEKNRLAEAAKPLLVLCEHALAKTNRPVDTMALLLPALSELIETDDGWISVKNAFKEHGLLRLMERYFERNNSMSEDYQEVFQRWIAL